MTSDRGKVEFTGAFRHMVSLVVFLLRLRMRRANCGGVDRWRFTLRRFHRRRSSIGGVAIGEA